MSQLPLDVIINILSLVPPSRDRRDSGALVLYSCLRANYLFREAALSPSLWKAHYQMRYRHSDDQRERARSETVNGNWRLMHAQRRKIDRAALKSLDKIVTSRIGLQEALTNLVRQSLDVWDVLELEATCPVPAVFSEVKQGLNGDTDEKIPEHAICRRYWAQNIRDAIARGYGIRIWRRLKSGSDSPSFELVMSSLSTFFGVTDKEITRTLDDLGIRCRQHLVEKGIVINEREADYDLRATCREICVFMRKDGFLCPPGGNEPHILNKFPHAYLTTHKATIPISLVHVFVAIATRLGIDAFPINFPGTVLSYVRPCTLQSPPLIVNPSSLNLNHTIVDNNVPQVDNLVLQIQIRYPHLAQLTPCDAETMLLRACRNIVASHRAMERYGNDPGVRMHGITLFMICVHLLLEIDDNDALRWLFSATSLRPLDCILLLEELAPYIRPRRKQVLELHCTQVLEIYNSTSLSAEERQPRDPSSFVGMPLHTNLNNSTSVGFLKSLYRAADQSLHYTLYSTVIKGASNMAVITKETPTPRAFTKKDIQYLYQTYEDFPLWFENVQLPKNPAKGIEHPEGRGRLLLSPHAKQRYPDDDAAGARWVEQGEL